MSWFRDIGKMQSEPLSFHKLRQLVCESGFSRDYLVLARHSRLKPLPQHGAYRLMLTPLFLALLLLSGCGFHLRGSVDLPPDVKSIYVQTEDRYSPFYRELIAVIQQNDLGPAGDPASADAIIRVLRDDAARRTVSVSARNVPVEYEVYYIVHCSVIVHGEQIIEDQRFILTRNYTYDDTKVLGKANEEVVLTDALAKNLVGLLVQTISAANK